MTGTNAIEKLFDTFEREVPMRGITSRDFLYSDNPPNLQTDEARLLIEARAELAELRRKADEADEYPDCENCRNTGHPWIDAGELSGYDYRVYCDCEQGQAMKAEAELTELREDRRRLGLHDRLVEALEDALPFLPNTLTKFDEGDPDPAGKIERLLAEAKEAGDEKLDS